MRALISVSDKTGVVEFAKKFISRFYNHVQDLKKSNPNLTYEEYLARK